MEINKTEISPEQSSIIANIAGKIVTLGHDAKFVFPISEGPIITCYRFLPQGKTKVSHLESLAQDFAVSLGVEDVLVKRMPGESAVGVFVPNKIRKPVHLQQTLVGPAFGPTSPVTVPLNFGVDHVGNPFVEDLVQLPHLLIAGSTGSGKSTLLHSIITSIIYSRSPDDIQMILCDTKQVEFGHFIGAPHLMFDPLKTVYEVLEKMDWLIEMTEARLKILSEQGVRNIKEYNDLVYKLQTESFRR
jgi:DNA segregation ATPase FtsK/SpoIIIE, S-DNA-T family